MAYIEDKIQQVQNKELRDILLAEVKKLKKEKKFGLVFEEHVPELVPVYSAPIRPRSTVALKDSDLLETFRVKRIKDGQATVTQDSDGRECVYPVSKSVSCCAAFCRSHLSRFGIKGDGAKWRRPAFSCPHRS